MNRRDFLRCSSSLGFAAAVGVGWSAHSQSGGANNRLRVGILGLGRGLDHANTLSTLAGVEIAYLCDVDTRRMEAGAKSLQAKLPNTPKLVQDFRRILEDRSVDAVFIATCNHWHAPATILACSAGKHVYVEKPGSHNAREGEWMVAAARKYRRVVQQGTQRRSYPGTQEGIQRLREGVIGKVRFARCWYNNSRTSIGRGKVVTVPSELDYSLWQGPAPERPYLDNLVHYNWHWRWHWGGGEMANNGVHYLDLARWGLGVEYPTRITYNGGRYCYEDDQETPDTGVAVFDFGSCGASWDYSSCHPRKGEKFPLVTFYGDQGSLSLEGTGYSILDPNGKELGRSSPPGNDQQHMGNFLDAIRGAAKLNMEIEEGQKSTLLCHLANIAYRTGHTLRFDPARKTILHDSSAMKLWQREYRGGWKPRF